MQEIFFEDERENYKDDIKGNQYVCLRILKIFDKICRENNLEYWLTDGTLLGAVRHKGFIPWDDDIDVCIKREDVNKLIKILQKQLPKDIFLQIKATDIDIEHDIIKLRDRYSSIEHDDGRNYHKGIWIDIFPMDEIKRNILFDKILKKLPGRFHYRESRLKVQIKRIILLLISLLLCKNIKSFEEARYNFYRLLSKNKLENNAYIYFEGQMWWETYLKKDIFPLKELYFEDLKCFVPNNYHEYLKYHYGNYMKIPKKAKQISHNKKIYLKKPCIHKESLNWELNKRIK